LFRIFGRTIVNAYGTTETGGLASNGIVSAGAEVRLIDCPQIGYTTADKPHPRGEILAHTPRIAGYFERSCCRSDGTYDSASSTSTDWVSLGGVRYFRTGDIGELIGKGQVKIIDRVKQLFKLQQGVFVAPQPVEEVLSESEFVRQIFVWGKSSMAAVAAVVVLPEIQNLLRLQDEIQSERQVLQTLREIGAKRGLKAWEIPQRVVLESNPFTVENGLLSAGGKLCRSALIMRYREKLSSDNDGAETDTDAAISTISSAEVMETGLCAGLLELLLEVAPTLRGTEAAFAADSSLVALGLDSIGIARLSSRLEQVFAVSLPPRVLYSLPTLADLESALFGGEAAIRRGAMRAEVVHWRGEVDAAARILKEELATLHAEVDTPRRTVKDTVLLTGATGFLGVFILRALMCETCPLDCARVVCIVRANDGASASARQKACMEDYGLTFDQHRVESVAGDLESEWLGLTKTAFCALAGQLHCVIHCGARVSSAIPYSALKESNVSGTRRALALAMMADADFVHISTMGFLPLGHAESRMVADGGLAAQTGYAQSKWVSEQLVSYAAEHMHCRARIVRPGVVCGDSSTGAANIKDATSMLLCGLVTEGVVCTEPRSPIPRFFNLCPCDSVAEAIVSIAAISWERHQAEFSEAAFHLCAPESLTLELLCDWLRGAGHELTDISAQKFCARVRGIEEGHPLFPMKALLSKPAPAPLATDATQATRFDTTLRDRALGGAPSSSWCWSVQKEALAKTMAFLLAATTVQQGV
jgi:fatty acid CoA ligase FadD9